MSVTDDWDETVSAVATSIDLDDVEAHKAYLVVVRGNNVGQSYPVIGPDMVIGRGAGADLRLNDDGVSRFHCKLRQQGGGIVVEDLGSRNGTYCNGERVTAGGTRSLAEGDRLQIGTTSVLRFTYLEVKAEAAGPLAEAGATEDPLTGTHGRRYFIDQLQLEFAAALARRGPLSIILIHIDRYTEMLASQGQDLTDRLTVEVVNRLRDKLRHNDLFARIDGGDFALMSRAASSGDMFMLAERLRGSSASLSALSAKEAQPVTLSLGVASLNELQIEVAHDLLLAAGSALSLARSQGGNRVVLCTRDLLQEPKNRPKV